MRPTSRRRFVTDAALMVAGGAMSVPLPACRSTGSSAKPTAGDGGAGDAAPVLQTFTRDSFLTLSAVCERLFPRDVDPGAIDLGVPQFIDRTVHDAEELSGVRALLVRTLPLLDKESERRFGARFHAAKPEDQDQLLESWQHGHDQTARFVALTLSLTLEGVFGDPKYGGNKGGRGFQLLAFAPDPPFVKSSPMPPMGHGAGH